MGKNIQLVDEDQESIVVATIKFKPSTLYFSSPSRCWLSGDLIMNGNRIGESEQFSFLPDEIKILKKIVQAATVRKNR